MSTRKPRSFKWAITIGLAFGTALIVVFTFLYKLPTVGRYASLYETGKQINKDFFAAAEYSKEEKAPYLKTTINDVFINFNSITSPKFCEYKDKSFNELNSKTLKAEIPINDKKETITFTTLSKDEKTEGYAVFQNLSASKTPYVFFKLTDNKTSIDGDYLIYADYSIEDFHKNDKTYSMVYTLDKESGETTPLISLDNARMDTQDIISDTYVLIPDHYAGQCPTELFYLSDRNYEIGKDFDLYSVGNSGKIIERNISTGNLFFNDGSTYYFKDNTTTFGLIEWNEEEPVEVKTYSGSASQYTVNGNFMFSPNTKMLYNLWTDDELGVQSTISLTGMQSFAVSKDMKKIAILGTFSGSKNRIFIYDSENDVSNVIEGDGMFIPNASNLTSLNSGILVSAPGENPDNVLNLVIPSDKIFSIKGS